MPNLKTLEITDKKNLLVSKAYNNLLLNYQSELRITPSKIIQSK